MAERLIQDKSLSNSIKTGNAYDAKNAITRKLNETLKRKMGLVYEDSDSDYNNPFLELSITAKTFGGEEPIENNGVIGIYFSSKQAVQDFADYLEDNKYVESYEINASLNNPKPDSDSIKSVDLESIEDDSIYKFEILLYLYPEYVQITDDETDEDDEYLDIEDSVYENYKFIPSEPIHEVVRKIRINSRNVKSIKMKCTRGFKYDPTISACVKIGGAELATIRRGARHAVITKRAEGSAYATRIKRRTLRAFKFRKMAGLGI